MGSKYGLPARLLLSGITIVVLTCGSSVQPAAAQDPVRNPARKIEEPPPATYVLRAVGTWGEEQNNAVAGAGGTVIYLHAGSGVAVVRSTSESFLEAVLLTGRFEGGGPDVLVKWDSSPSADESSEELSAQRGDGTGTLAVPGNETLINSQWPLQAIHAPEAWNLGYEGEGVRVAVLDGGICNTHTDLDANLDMVAARSFVEGHGVTEDAIGFRRACFLSGIIAAEDNNAGVIGVAPKAAIIPCKVLHNGAGTLAAVVEGILYASDPVSEGGAGADIILLGANTVLTPDNHDNFEIARTVERAIHHAKTRNVLVISGAGDDATDLDALDGIHIPAHCGALAVAAGGPIGYAVGWPNGNTDFDRPAGYTNTGAHTLWLSAPGGDSSLDPGLGICRVARVPSGTTNLQCYVFDGVVSTGYVTGSNSVFTWSTGTGAAAAHVAGVAALVLQRFPGLEAREVMAHLGTTADDDVPGLDPYRGRGYVDALAAVSQPLNGVDLDGDAPADGYASKPSGPVVAAGLRLSIHPNPIHEGASFALTIPEAGPVRLGIFDLAGRNIAVLLDGMAAAGPTVLQWDGRGRSGRLVTPGAYFARLVTPSGTLRKMVIVSP